MSFRETLWFKKGDLDARAAQDAAAAPEEDLPGRADSLPIEDRYDDDGSVSPVDSKVYSLRTGSLRKPRAARPSGDLQAHVIVREMKRQRRIYLAMLAGAVVVGCALMFIL